MTTYTITAAFNVSCYITKEIEADSEEEAKAKLQKMAHNDELWSDWTVEYGSADQHRIISLEGVDGIVILEDVYYNSPEWEELKKS